ncbi:MAG: phosphate regulon sensor histidine kinase PhoR [Betaproteobacteria bacterium]|nr:phosphate regulon sensor histidine kinase PhoR [Betaproteobacteria bacterium]
MAPGWRPAWLALLPRLLLILCAALIARAWLGPVWAWAVAAVGSIFIVLAQTRQLIALAVWLQAPETAGFPDAGGLWGEVFIRLSRRLRADAKAVETASADLSSFREAIQALPEGIVLLDAGQQIRWCNHAAKAHLGIRLPNDAGAIVGQLVRAPGFAEYLRHPDGIAPFVLQPQAARARVYELRVVPFGERNKILLSFDVTDAKRVEAMRSDFVANVSHELRTPLTVVAGFLEHFGNDGAMSGEERQHFARLMTDQTSRMLSLIDDLLTLSRLESEDAPASEERIDMDAMLARLSSDGESLSGGRHHITARAGGPGLRGNWKELHSAFGNLVSNAIRYTPEGGSVHIGWNGTFSVRDSGVGVSAEHLPRLTERFYRADRGRSRDTGGTGLGLAIVKHVLLRHQAALHIESQPGAGSTFSAEFPAWRLAE